MSAHHRRPDSDDSGAGRSVPTQDQAGRGEEAGLSRRRLLTGTAGLAWTALAGSGATTDARTPTARGAERPPGPAPGLTPRARQAFEVRQKAARLQRDLPVPRHQANGDEEAYPSRVACYGKGLPHDGLGQVDPKAYDLLLRALRSGAARDFEQVPIGGRVKLANPQSALAYNLVGPDPSQSWLQPAPRFDSAEQAGEMVELYWHALARDVPFAEYESHPLIAKAAGDLSRLSDFRGPRQDGRVTPRTLFRGHTAGDLPGPYVSQFLWKDVSFTPIQFEQKIRTAAAGLDHLTDFDGWLANLRGAIAGPTRFDGQRRHVRNGRDLGEYVHRDFTYQAPLGACLILLKLGALPDGANPYKHSRTQSGFTTFGAPYLLHLLATVTQVALTACWYQKWMVHRRVRPEEFAGRVEVRRRGKARYPIHPEVLESPALETLLERTGTALLPMAYPEGCPTHPAYPAGHAAIAGACVTILKAFFDESSLVPEPVEASADGLALRRYEGAALTVGAELDKLASNISLGRDFAGVHWRSDSAEGLRLGEAVAIAVLREMKLTGNEIFDGFQLHTFDGSRLVV